MSPNAFTLLHVVHNQETGGSASLFSGLVSSSTERAIGAYVSVISNDIAALLVISVPCWLHQNGSSEGKAKVCVMTTEVRSS